MMHGYIASLKPIIELQTLKIDQNDTSSAGGLLIDSLGRWM
jgi:hypothetical protein